MKKPRKVLRIGVHKSRGKWSITADGKGYDGPSLLRLLNAITDASDDDTVLDFPIIREGEDPDLVKRLDKALADVRAGRLKTIPWSQIKRKGKAS
jgi:hypothetical protein